MGVTVELGLNVKNVENQEKSSEQKAVGRREKNCRRREIAAQTFPITRRFVSFRF